METTKKRVLLIGWDAADWDIIHPLMDQGLLPGVSYLVEQGVSGKLRTMQPSLSPMLWSTIATGRIPRAHGIHGFAAVDQNTGTIRSTVASDLQVPAVWDILRAQSKTCHVVNWFATHGAQANQGIQISDQFSNLSQSEWEKSPEDRRPSSPGTVFPESLKEEVDLLRIAPTELDAEGILRFLIPEAHLVDQKLDPKIGHLAAAMAQSYSTHAAVTASMELQPDWDFCSVYLPALDEISHLFMPLRAPRQDHVDEKEFSIYQHVIDRAYRLHDQMLQRLIQLAGDDATIVLVSDHGFHTGSLRPAGTPSGAAGMTAWHREHGVIAMAGPGIRKDELIHGARILDVTPTILSHMGIPISKEMEGRVLAEAFDHSPEIEYIETWANESVKAGGETSCSGNLLTHFARLGYLDPKLLASIDSHSEVKLENHWHLGLSEFHLGNYESAMILFEECLFERPERVQYLEMLARCQIQLGLLDEAEELIEMALDQIGSRSRALLLRGAIALERGDPKTAVRQIRSVLLSAPNNPHYLQLYGKGQVLLREWEEAELTTRRLIEIDPKDAEAYLRLARIALHRSDNEEAVSLAQQSISLDFGLADARLILCLGLMKQKKYEEAHQHLEILLQLVPESYLGWRLLSTVRKTLGRSDSKEAYINAYKLRGVKKSERERRLKRLRQEASDRADERVNKRQAQREQKSLPTTELNEITIVTGLPRSGTSLVMQILEAGGYKVFQDEKRSPDISNPKGYYEWTAIKSLPAQPHLIREANHQAVKVVTPLLPFLEREHRYKIIEVIRPLEEVVLSQLAMLGSENPSEQEKEDLQKLLIDHQKESKRHIDKLSDSKHLQLTYSDLIYQTKSVVQELQEFLGMENLPRLESALSVPDPSLYRQQYATHS